MKFPLLELQWFSLGILLDVGLGLCHQRFLH